MEDFRVYEEISADGKNTSTYASWIHKGTLYITSGCDCWDGNYHYLRAHTIRDGVKKEVRIDSPNIMDIKDKVRAYREKRYFDNLKAELYKDYKKNEKDYHLSDHSLCFFLEGKHLRLKPTPMAGFYEVLHETGGGKETHIGYKVLTESEYLKMAEESNENGRG